ncbi:hypothetical protein [Acetobacter nitrogenifigens]|uniref:hypothetical protein n=1 Tax=Acetobacter nitrogenifigens TaxID=285268 RepID=UPI0004296F9A|nr:hypothetical protein [Acetobacter nitrogenifigens]
MRQEALPGRRTNGKPPAGSTGASLRARRLRQGDRIASEGMKNEGACAHAGGEKSVLFRRYVGQFSEVRFSLERRSRFLIDCQPVPAQGGSSERKKRSGGARPYALRA